MICKASASPRLTCPIHCGPSWVLCPETSILLGSVIVKVPLSCPLFSSLMLFLCVYFHIGTLQDPTPLSKNRKFSSSFVQTKDKSLPPVSGTCSVPTNHSGLSGFVQYAMLLLPRRGTILSPSSFPPLFPLIYCICSSPPSGIQITQGFSINLLEQFQND